MLLHYYRGHPASVADAVRSAVAVALTWLWSARLTHNYLRREGWEFGKREDWRFNEMRGQYGKTWWWMSFFAVYLSQQVMLLFTEFAFCFKLEITDRHHKTIHNLFIGTHSSLYNI